MSRFVASFVALAAATIALTGCCCDNNPCDPCCAPRPKCCARPCPRPCPKPCCPAPCDPCGY